MSTIPSTSLPLPDGPAGATTAPASTAGGEATLELELRQALEASGQRFTGQRLLVYQFLAEQQAQGIHPTAEDVFRGVRPAMPTISLATVYKSLEVLEECGLIRKLTGGADGRAHYDFRVDAHHHARDLTTGRLFDVEGELDPKVLAGLRKPKGFRVVNYHIEMEGYFDESAERA